MNDLENRVKALIFKSLKIKDISCVRNERTLTELGADSLDAVELIMAVEQEFGIKVDGDNFEHLTTVQSIIDFVRNSNG
jgi:acyl carrier protein